MWHEIFEGSTIVIATLLCAIAVKLVDDFLDKDMDNHRGSSNFTIRWGNGTIIYAMLFLTIAASINGRISIPLFLASYSIGMFNDLKQSFPSGLKGWQEAVVILILGISLWGWQLMLFSVLLISSIQLFDDYLDIHIDESVGYRNIASHMGKVECLLLSIITMLTAWLVEEQVFPFVFLGTFLFYSMLLFYQKGE